MFFMRNRTRPCDLPGFPPHLHMKIDGAIGFEFLHYEDILIMAEAKIRKKIAIVTGASSGLGAEFALQIEKNFYLDEIWLIARRAVPMKVLAEKFLKSHAVILPLDLTNKSDLAAFEKRLATENPEIEFLVNNAGYGKIGPFDQLGTDEQIKMIELNITALTFLSRIGIQYMKPGASLIQVASSAAFSPAPFFAVYAATKSYVVSLSDALGFELRDQGIKVIAVCPGPVETEFFSVAQKNEFMKDKVGEAEPFNHSLYSSPRNVVAKALTDLSKGRRHSIFGFSIKLFSAAASFVPIALKLRALANRTSSK